jgi:hypothetical protein
VLTRGVLISVLAVAACVLGATPAAAQRLPFERTVDVAPGATLDVSTYRGKIAIVGHDARQIRIDGTVTVRVLAGFNAPSNALELARRVSEHPRIDVSGNVVRLRPPLDAAEQQAVTVSYELRVPRDTTVVVASDSGEVSVLEVAAPVTITTGSSAVSLRRIDGKAEVKTDSGEVTIDGARGGVRLVTGSSRMTLRALEGPLEARTQSGEVRASFAGRGTADVETGSSAIQLDGLSDRVTVRSQSGRVTLRGAPAAEWNVTTGSSVIEASFDPSARFTLEATSGSSSVRVAGVAVDGTVAKGQASGRVGGGGPRVRLASRSGQVHIGR